VPGTLRNGIEVMETRTSKLAWAIGGAIIGSVASVLIDKVILPYFEGRPNIEVLAKRDQPGRAQFEVYNSGSKEVSDVWLSARLADPFQARVDILSADHQEDDIGGKCEYRIVNSVFRTGRSESIHTVLNTESASLEIRCSLLNPGEKWSAQLGYKKKQDVSGVLVHVKYPGTSETLYAFFADS